MKQEDKIQVLIKTQKDQIQLLSHALQESMDDIQDKNEGIEDAINRVEAMQREINKMYEKMEEVEQGSLTSSQHLDNKINTLKQETDKNREKLMESIQDIRNRQDQIVNILAKIADKDIALTEEEK